MRFYLDEHFSPRIAEIARGHGLDVVSALELGDRGLPDLWQLEFAAQNRWFEAERFEGSTHFPSIEAPELVATAARRLTTRTGFAPTLPI